jgi:hypothetical protein
MINYWGLYTQNKNEVACRFKDRESMLQLITNGWWGETQKLVQFATLFHFLKHGKTTLEYKAHKQLLIFLILMKSPKCIGWA